MRGTEDAQTLKANLNAVGGQYGDITILLDRKSSGGNLVITISIDDGVQTMATCTCKYLVTEVAGNLQYDFREYY